MSTERNLHTGLHTTLSIPSHVSEIVGLQQLRCLAVLLVAWFHCELQVDAKMHTSIPTVGGFGVDLFFIISGFIISKSVERLKGPRWGRVSKFARRRMVRIYPIYWLVATIGMLQILHSHARMDASAVSGWLLIPPVTYPDFMVFVPGQWTLIFEVFFYSITAIAVALSQHRAVVLAVIILIALPLVGLLFDIRHPILVVVFNPMLYEFVFGAVLAFAYVDRRRIPKVVSLLMVLVGLALVPVLQKFGPAAANGPQMVFTADHVFPRVFTLGVAAALIVAGTVLGQLSIPGVFGKLSTILGNASYSIYLLEGFVLNFIYRALSYHSFRQGSLTIALSLCGIGVVVQCVVGWLSYQFVEWPLTRYLNRRFAA